MKNAHLILIAALTPSLAGCWGWIRGDMGFVTSTTLDEGRQGFTFGGDIGGGDDNSGMGMNLGLRGKITKDVADVGLHLDALYLYPPDPVGFYVLGGANLFQLGTADERFSGGAFSPGFEAGFIFPPLSGANAEASRKDQKWLMLGTRIQYDLRFTDQPHEGFWTVNLGYALGAK